MNKNPFHALDLVTICEIVRTALGDRVMQDTIGERLDLDEDYLNDLHQEVSDVMENASAGTMAPEEFVKLVNRRKGGWTNLRVAIKRDWFEEDDAPVVIIRRVAEKLRYEGFNDLSERLLELGAIVRDGNDAALVVGQMVSVELI